MTKEERRKYNKKYHEKNKERILVQKKEYNEKNKERIREYRGKNKERIREYKKEWTENLLSGIYKIINTKTDKVYIGQSSAYLNRWHTHKSRLRNNKHDNPSLQEDYNTYGEEAFVFEVIEELPCDTSSGVLLKKEAEQIIKHLREGKDIYNSLN